MVGIRYLLDTCSLVLNGPSWTSYRTSSDVTTASTSMDEFAGKYMKRGEILAPLGNIFAEFGIGILKSGYCLLVLYMSWYVIPKS